MRRGESEESLRIWLEILQEDANNRYARLGLDTVRKLAGKTDGIEELFESRKYIGLVPSPGFYLPRWTKRLIAGCLITAFVLVPALLILNRTPEEPEPRRPEVAAIVIEAGEAVIDTGSRAVNMLTEQEIRDSFEGIKNYFENYQDTFARREINRLLLSNASQTVKAKVSSFIPSIITPNFVNFPESFDFHEVMSDPALYDGCFVRWRGRVSNVVITPQRITLDFLAGYADQRVLYGIVPAWIEFAINLQTDFAYEVIAQVNVIPGRPGITLQIFSIRELGL